MNKKIIIPLIIFLILVGIGFGIYRHYHPQASERSAVFMTNGQVYFGYLTSANQNTVTLNDVYYLKLSDLQNSTNKQILLVKMGNELHGPQNNMYINRSQILFWQTLRPDSKINDAITKFNTQPSSNSGASSGSSTNTTTR